ncbi:MAG: Uma2 family endonuclease [Chloroflexi bacterium]|nr:Uma2 family endonuclease [Chloroflexota bacterium]
MAIKEKLYTVDDVWRLAQLPENEQKHFYLIDGELFWNMPPGYRHGRLEILIGHYLLVYAEEHDLGEVTGAVGYYPADVRHTLLAPDVAFVRKQAAPADTHDKFVARMPDLAVVIQSPSNTLAELRRKAAVYLANGTELVWLVLPERAGVEVWRADADGEAASEFIARDGSLTGEPVLPGFTLDLQKLFPN